MKLGRACAAGAVLWAVALPLTAGTALADQEPAPSAPAQAPTATPSDPAPAERAPATDTAPPSAVPAERAPAADTAPQREAQVPVRPQGAPETGGGPETGTDLALTGGAAVVVAAAAGGAVLVLRRRRAGAR